MNRSYEFSYDKGTSPMEAIAKGLIKNNEALKTTVRYLKKEWCADEVDVRTSVALKGGVVKFTNTLFMRPTLDKILAKIPPLHLD